MTFYEIMNDVQTTPEQKAKAQALSILEMALASKSKPNTAPVTEDERLAALEARDDAPVPPEQLTPEYLAAGSLWRLAKEKMKDSPDWRAPHDLVTSWMRSPGRGWGGT